MSDNINIKKGIFQGDSLSLTTLLHFTHTTLIRAKDMNDLKFYAKNDSEIEGLLGKVKGFSDDINMEFGLSKCTKATFNSFMTEAPII